VVAWACLAVHEEKMARLVLAQAGRKERKEKGKGEVGWQG
jgi:hypothetical protein